jgi:hypothetical protein
MNESQLWGLVDAMPQSGGCFVEWGCGGSTLWVLGHVDLDECYSIEHNPAWHRRVQSEVSDAGFAGRASIIFAPERATREPVTLRAHKCEEGVEGGRVWNQVEEESPIGMWDYCSGSLAPLERADVILVDGLVRQSCLCEASARAKVGCHLFLHDSEDPIYRWGVGFVQRHPGWQLVQTYKPLPEDEYPDMEMSEWVRVG